MESSHNTTTTNENNSPSNSPIVIPKRIISIASSTTNPIKMKNQVLSTASTTLPSLDSYIAQKNQIHHHLQDNSKDIDDQRDDSFQTQETASESDSEADDNGSSNDCLNLSDHSFARLDEQDSTQHHSVRFADEIGLSLRTIHHYVCDRKQREHSELIVLCISPEMRKFEFLQVGYHKHNEDSSETAPCVQDLLRSIPSMCTDSFFSNANFVSLYRRKGVEHPHFENMCVSQSTTQNEDTLSVPLQDCGFRENEMIVAAIEDSSETAVLQGIGSLLGNNLVRKSLKQGCRSKRGLKFVTGSERQRTNHNDKDKENDNSDPCNYLTNDFQDYAAIIPKQRAAASSILKNPNYSAAIALPNNTSLDDFFDPPAADEVLKGSLIGILAVGWGTIILNCML